MNFLKLFFSQVVILAFSYKVAQCQFSPFPIDTAIKNSQFIFEGDIISSTPFFGPDSVIYTSSIVEISKIYKGGVKCGNVEIITYQSAVIGKSHIHVSDASDVVGKGEYGMFMCIPSSRPSLETPKENSIAFMPYGIVEYKKVGSNIIGSWWVPFPSIEAVYDTFNTALGHGYTSCDILKEPFNGSNLQNMGNNPVGSRSQKDINALINGNANIIQEVEIFPNPVANTATIKIPDNVTKAVVSIYDDSGRIVFQKWHMTSSTLMNIDLSGLKPGNYIGRVIDLNSKVYGFRLSRQ